MAKKWIIQLFIARNTNTPMAVIPGRTKTTTPEVYVIDGEIGAGKSTLLHTLAETIRKKGLEVCTVPEPVALWREIGILAKFYANPSEEAFTFQVCTFATRTQAMQDAVALQPNADIYILERTILTDRNVFMELQRDMVDECDMKIYELIFKPYAKMTPLDLTTAKYIYLKPSLEECMTRVSTRGREEEVTTVEGKKEMPAKGGVSLTYQTMLRKAHEAYLQGMHTKIFPKMPERPFSLDQVVVIEGVIADGNFKNDHPDSKGIAEAILLQLGLTAARSPLESK